MNKMGEYVEMAENLEENGVPVIRQIVRIGDGLFRMAVCRLDELACMDENVNGLNNKMEGVL